MMTLSGRNLTLDNDEAPSISDIAIGLAHTNRFGGQTLIPWNDAQHSLVCAMIALYNGWGTRMQLIMLLHDAHEMITGDACRPFKPEDMSELQEHLDERIYRSLGVKPPTEWERVNCGVFDNQALLAEAFVVTPRRTYRQACEDMGVEATVYGVRYVQTILREVADPAETYEYNLRNLLREVYNSGT